MNVKKAIIVAVLGIVAIPAVASANARHNNDRETSSKNQNQVFATQIDSQTQNQAPATENQSQKAADNTTHRVVAAKTHPFFKFLFGR
jgi:hypothetical protein